MKHQFKMEMVIFCLLGTFIVIADSMVSNSTQLNGRVIRGVPVKANEMLFMASLRINDSHIGGGSLISKKHILTAAQCIVVIEVNGGVGFAFTSVLIGKVTEQSTGILVNVANVHYHESFNCPDLFTRVAHDVGIVLLGREVTEIDSIDFGEAKIVGRMKGLFAGWGSREINDRNKTVWEATMSPILNSFSVTVIKREVCKSYPGFKRIIEFVFCGCAAVDYQHINTGDVGGSLIYSGNVIGIASEIYQGEKEENIIFVKVSRHRDYITLMQNTLQKRIIS